MSTFHSDENVGGGSLYSPQKYCEDALPSSSPIVDAASTVVVTATARAQTKEGEIVTMAS